MNTISKSLALAVLASSAHAATTISFDFNGGSSDGFTPGGAQTPITANAYINNLHGALGIDGITTVLTADDINVDPQLTHAAVALPLGEVKWSTFEMRFRQLDMNPGQAGVAGSPFVETGALVIIGGKNTTAITTGTTVVGTDSFVKTLTTDGAGEWMHYTINLAGTSIQSNAIAIRIDPVGNDGAKNFEIDYVRLNAIPEPSSALLSLLATGLILVRRRK